MLIGVQRRFVFIANSKTASTSIETLLHPYAEIRQAGSPARKHMGWQAVLAEYAALFAAPGQDPASFFRFGVIREPVEWVRSWFNYRKGGAESVGSRFRDDLSFESFWRRGDWVRARSQGARFLDADGVCRFDLLIPMEQIGALWPLVEQRIGVPAQPLPRRNRSKAQLARADIPPALAEEINAHYATDLAMWRAAVAQAQGILADPRPFTAAAGRAAARVPGSVRIETPDSADIVFRRVEAELEAAGSGRRLTLKGVLLPADTACGARQRLLARSSEGEQSIEWGIPSPAVATRFPDHPRADRCRFRGSIEVPGDGHVELLLADEHGARRPVASVRV